MMLAIMRSPAELPPPFQKKGVSYSPWLVLHTALQVVLSQASTRTCDTFLKYG